MRQIKNLLRYFFFFVIIQGITLFSLYLFKEQELSSFINERQTEIKGQYNLVTHTYQQRMKMAYERLSTPEMLALIEKVLAADREEQTRLRREVYNMALPLYQHLRKNSFRQIHFHLADGTSFLRMHMPEFFGDQLADLRPSIMQVNSTKLPVAGYEMGRNWQAYRFIFPLTTAVGHYLGSVEIGIPLSTFLNELMASFPAEYCFITNKQMAEKYLDAANLRDHFTVTSFADDFLMETADQKAVEAHNFDSLGNRNNINPQIIEQINQGLQKTYGRHLPANKAVSLPYYLACEGFLVHLLPIHDISGAPAGYLMTYERSPTLISMKWRYTIGYLLVTAFSLLVIGGHILYTTKLLNRMRLLKRLQRELNESHADLDQIFNTAADGMRLIDLNFEIKRANITFADLVKMPQDQIIGKKCYDIFPGSDCHTENCPLRLISKGIEHIEHDAEKIRPDGTILSCMITATPFYNDIGELTGIIEDFRDISERKRLEQQLQALSTTDELTGLCNRRGFMNLAQQQLNYVERGGGEVFIIFADLDNMKWINDTLGHEIGDMALILTAKLLRIAVRDTDIIGRMGGDEFAVLLTSVSSSDSEPIILTRLEQELAEINKGLPLEQQISISFGIVHNQGGFSLDELLALADVKMYAAKKKRKTAAGPMEHGKAG